MKLNAICQTFWAHHRLFLLQMKQYLLNTKKKRLEEE